MALQIVLIIILEKSKLIHLIIHLNIDFHNVIILIQSAVKKDKINYYNNIFLEKGSYEDKFDTKYF